MNIIKEKQPIFTPFMNKFQQKEAKILIFWQINFNTILKMISTGKPFFEEVTL